MAMPTNTFEDERDFRTLSFKWSLATDTKNQAALLELLTPDIVADYSDFPAVNTIRRVSAQAFAEHAYGSPTRALGHPDLKTQHFLGNATFTRPSLTEAKGTFQARAYHVRDFKDGRVAEWNISNLLEFTYTKVGEEWKIAGWRPHTVVAEVGKHDDVIGLA